MKKLIALVVVFALLGSLVFVEAALAAPKHKEPKEKSNNRDNEKNNRDNENSNRDHDKERPEKDAPKAEAGVLICHVTGKVVMLDGTAMVWGKVIRVSESAVEAHLAHGDVLADEGAQKGDDCWTLLEMPAGHYE